MSRRRSVGVASILLGLLMAVVGVFTFFTLAVDAVWTDCTVQDGIELLDCSRTVFHPVPVVLSFGFVLCSIAFIVAGLRAVIVGPSVR